MPSVVSKEVANLVTFSDEQPGQHVEVASISNGVAMSDMTPNVELAEFLSRPVRIYSYTWNEADPIATEHVILPWKLFFDDQRIKFKIHNYSFLRCNLKVKIVLNASPFYYGMSIAAYHPLPNFNRDNIVRDSGTKYFIPISQRPHLFFNAQNSEGGEMTLPFLFHRNWIRVQKISDFINMGDLNLFNFTQLQSANGASGSGVTVQVYAWAEDVQLSGPSVGLALQSRDEYDGPVSKPASAVAAAMGRLASIPSLRPWATAAQIGAEAVRNGAYTMGYSNTPVIDPQHAFKPVAAPPLASSEISFPFDKLTLDPKNELTIDPCIHGLKNIDELSIAHLVQKESYLTTANWSTTNAPDDILFSSAIAPGMYDCDNATQQKVYMTPMCWISQMFEHWRGDIIFKFRFVASQYHKGRVRIIYDPAGYAAGNIILDTVSTSVVFNEIVDLAKDTTIEVRVPYQQAISWMKTAVPTSATIPWSTSTSPTFSIDDNYQNGTIVMRVLTALTAPISSSSINVLVSVRGAPNLEFANPKDILDQKYTQMVVQSQDEYDDGATTTVVAGNASAVEHPCRYLMHFGEAVPSMRQLLRRLTLSKVFTIGLDSTHNTRISTFTLSRWPMPYGYDSNGYNAATSLVTTGPKGFNWCEHHPIPYILGAFLGTRGSVNWNFNVDVPNTIRTIRAYRNNNASKTPGFNDYTATTTGANRSIDEAFYATNTVGGAGGQTYTNQLTQAGLSVSIPNFSPFNFQRAFPSNVNGPGSDDGSSYDTFNLEVWSNPSSNGSVGRDFKMTASAGIGSDFTALFFLNVPTYWIMSAIPTPV